MSPVKVEPENAGNVPAHGLSARISLETVQPRGTPARTLDPRSKSAVFAAAKIGGLPSLGRYTDR
jgi:hypothetical protein